MLRHPAAIASPLEADIDPVIHAVTLPPSDRWDLGGIGKGLACDLLVEELWARGVRQIMVNLGGDLRVHGAAFDEPCWTVQVDDPLDPGTVRADVHLSEGAVATSSRARRRWRHEGRAMHHLIDPRTGLPAETDLVAATVVAASAWWAEVLAKAVVIAGADRGPRLVEQAGCSALLFGADGSTERIGDHFRLAAVPA
ncbi:MAG: FAD:protein FMN transferase [Acidimicrobiales bacterium]